MKFTSTIILLLLLSVISTFSQETHLQIVAEPGITIYLDGTYEGVTNSEFGGLIIKNVSPGRHTVRAVKEGYQPQEEAITISAGSVYEYTVRPFAPGIVISESGVRADKAIKAKTGSLLIQSLPIGIHLHIPRLGVSREKQQDKFRIDNVPIGSYTAHFSYKGRKISKEIFILSDQLSHVNIDMTSGELEYRGATSNELNRRNEETERQRQIEEEREAELERTRRLQREEQIRSDNEAAAKRARLEREENERKEAELKARQGTFVDERDGQVYKTIRIGNQIWMAENLNYSAGVAYRRDKRNANIYGRLYDWRAACNVCPEGWHLPSDEEWKELEVYFGMSKRTADLEGFRGDPVGYKLKSKPTLWNEDINKYTNESHFNALPAGTYGSDGMAVFRSFHALGDEANFWTSTKYDFNQAWDRSILDQRGDISRSQPVLSHCFSVRCIKD